MNKLHALEFPLLEPLKEKRRVSRLYIDADEDHVSLQYLEKRVTLKSPALIPLCQSLSMSMRM